MATENYKNLSEIARSHGVTPAAVTGWTKKATWPKSLSREAVDRFVSEWVKPHRKGGNRRPDPTANASAVKSPAADPATTSIAAPTPAPPIDIVTSSLEDLERAIRRATSTEQAETLSKQVRALKVVREIQDRDGTRIDAVQARGEIQSAFHFLQTAVMNLPRSIANSLERLEAAEIETILEGRLLEMLGELKRGLQRAIKFESEPHALDGNARGTDRSGEADPQPDRPAVSGAKSAPVIAAGPVG